MTNWFFHLKMVFLFNFIFFKMEKVYAVGKATNMCF